MKQIIRIISSRILSIYNTIFTRSGLRKNNYCLKQKYACKSIIKYSNETTYMLELM